MTKLGQDLMEDDFLVNGLSIVISDGEDTTSSKNLLESDSNGDYYTHMRKAWDNAKKKECLESHQGVLIFLGDDEFSTEAQRLKNSGLEEVIIAGKFDESCLDKVVDFIATSVSSTSQVVGTGSPSQLLSFGS